ncbi:MAG: helix-turn-helix domain-containing protein [Clostridia bacterium]|nr:helix-turn-helix domain-containing protein [Clostridia bacterium]
MKRNWTNIKELEPQIMAMREAGKTRRQIAEELGLNKTQIKNWVNRHNKGAVCKGIGLTPKKRGRKPAVTLQEYKYENKRLKMENELLRDFLYAAGRK